MARKPTAVRQVELTRALRAAKNAGIEVASVEIDTTSGKIVIMTAAAPRPQPANPLDGWLTKRQKAEHARAS